MSGSFRTKFTCYSGFQTQQRIYAFSNDQEHPHDQRLLESVINRETSVVGGKNPTMSLLVVVCWAQNPLITNNHHLRKKFWLLLHIELKFRVSTLCTVNSGPPSKIIP